MIRTRYLVLALFVFSVGLSANGGAEVAVAHQDLDESLSQAGETTSPEAAETEPQAGQAADEPEGEEPLAPESAAPPPDEVTSEESVGGQPLEEAGVEEPPVQEETVADSPDTSVKGVIYHQAPDEALAEAPLTLEVVVEMVDVAVTSVIIYHRIKGQSSYQELAMSEASASLFVGTLSAIDLQVAGLEYYLIAVLSDGSVIAYPTVDPTSNPVNVPVSPNPEAVAGSQDMFGGIMIEQSDLLILSPEPNETLGSEEVVVAISLFNLPDVDLSSIQLILDDVDVTAHADLSADIITYSPLDLSAGQHNIEFRATTLAGNAYQPVSWPFRVAGRLTTRAAERDYQHSGTITPNYLHTDIDGEVLNISSVRMTYRGGWDWLKFRSRLKRTSDEDAFKSPRNRYFIEFETPVLTLGLGDVTPRLNRFTLDGKRVRGYDANLNLKYFHLRIVKGELARGIQGRPESAYEVDEYQAFESGLADTLRLTRKGYTFKRDVLAIRPSLGSGERFQWSFSYVKAKDVISSVNEAVKGQITITDSTFNADHFQAIEYDPETKSRIVSFQDIVDEAMTNSNFGYVLPADDWVGKSPQDNLVIGSDVSLVLSKRRFTIQSGFALSMLNRNIWDPVLSKEELDTFAPGDDTTDGFIGGEDGIALENLPIDPAAIEDYFHINLNQVPLLPIDVIGLQTDPLRAIRNMPSLAYHATAKLNYLNNFITMEYQQVGPDFNSLANPNIQKNVRIRSISDRIRLFRNKLFISALYRSTDDDIVKLKDDNITSTVTVNLSGNLNLGYGLPGLSLGTRTYTRDNGIVLLDTISSTDIEGGDDRYIDRRSSTLTKSLNFGLNYQLRLLTSTHDLSLNLANTNISDQIDDRRPNDTLYTTPRSPAASSRILSLAASSVISNRLRTNFTLATNTSEFGEGATLVAQSLFSIALTARYQLMDGKMLVRGGFNRISSNSDASGSESKPPPNFSRLGIKGGLEILLVDNLRWVTSLEFRTKQIEGIAGSVGSSIITSNLQYRF